MPNPTPNAMLATLEAQLDLLIARCAKLETENSQLHQAQLQWQEEKAQLLFKQNLACSTLETLVQRLQALEVPHL